MPFAADEGNLESLAQRTFWGVPLSFPCAGYQLQANLHLPPNAGTSRSLPAVVLVHGLGGNRHEAFGLFLKTAGALAVQGMCVLRFDGRGAGETGGSTRDISLPGQIEDISAAVDFLRTHESVDADRLALVGLSMGGLAAACCAGQRTDIKALSIWEAPFNLYDTMSRLLGPLTIHSVRSTGYVQVGFLQLGQGFFETIEHWDTAATVAKYRNPVLITHGTGDQIVSIDNVEPWRQAFHASNPEIFLVEDADHAFTKDAWAWPLINKTASWLKEHI